jgi:predicted MFS family arabinose efflux permease
MVGIVSAGMAGSQLVVAPLANQLIINYGWRTSYLILGIITLIALVVTAQFIKRDPYQIGQLPDGASKEMQSDSDLKSTGLSLREAIHTRRMRMLFIVYFNLGILAFSMLLHIVPHATDLGISAVSAAAILSILGGLGIVARVGMGSAADRIGTKRSLTIGLILTTATLFWLPYIQDLGMFYVFAGVFGFAWGTSIVLQSPLLAESFGMKAHGAILGVLILAFTLGGTVGPLLTGYMFDVTGSYQSAFLVFAILSMISLILAMLLQPTGSAGLMKTV